MTSLIPTTGAAASSARVEAAAPPRSPRPFYGWRIVRTLAVTETISWGVLYYAFTVLLLPMRRDLGFSTATLTGAFSLSVAVTGIAAIPVGRWVDRHGTRLLMTAGSVAGVLLVLAWSRVHTVAGLYLVFAGIGVVWAAVLYEPAFAVAVRWFSNQRAKALLTLTVVAGFASTIFLPTTAALEDAWGWRQALWALAGILAVGTVLPHAIVLRHDPADLGLHPDGSAIPTPDPVLSTAPASHASDTLRNTAGWARRDRRFWILTMAYAANTLAIIIVSVHLIPFLVENGHGTAFAATAAGALGALSVAGRVTVTGAIPRWPTTRVTASVFTVQALGCGVLLASGTSTFGAVVFVLLFGLGFGVGTITRPALTAAAFGTTSYATLAALIGVALTATKALGPVSAGLVRSSTGDYTLVLLLVAAACLVSAAAVWRLGNLPDDAVTEQPRPVGCHQLGLGCSQSSRPPSTSIGGAARDLVVPETSVAIPVDGVTATARPSVRILAFELVGDGLLQRHRGGQLAELFRRLGCHESSIARNR